jgi:hypothetical protein
MRKFVARWNEEWKVSSVWIFWVKNDKFEFLIFLNSSIIKISVLKI